MVGDGGVCGEVFFWGRGFDFTGFVEVMGVLVVSLEGGGALLGFTFWGGWVCRGLGEGWGGCEPIQNAHDGFIVLYRVG